MYRDKIIIGEENKVVRKKKIKLTDHVSYYIVDNTIYLFQDNDFISLEEIKILGKRLSLIIDDNDIAYINISSKRIEDRKEFYQDLGFSLSYYDVNKLNVLYSGIKNKIDYRCYGIMTKKDFFDKINSEDRVNDNIIINDDSGYIYNIFLLFGGIILLCYFCTLGAIYLVK